MRRAAAKPTPHSSEANLSERYPTSSQENVSWCTDVRVPFTFTFQSESMIRAMSPDPAKATKGLTPYTTNGFVQPR